MFKLDLVKASLREVAEALQNGKISSEELVNAYLGKSTGRAIQSYRIEKDNIKGLELRAVIDVRPRNNALQVARVLDEERASGKIRSPLHGVPIIVKDSIGTDPSMGMQTTGGLNALEDSQVVANAPIVDCMLDAGLIIIAKANMTALGNYYYGAPRSGWSPRGGQTRSAYVGPDFRTGGSSSGSAVALSAGFCAAAVGCETSGSIVSPARHAALYALKPSGQLVPNAGLMPITSRVDTAGPMGKTTWDVAALLDRMIPGPHPSFVTVVENAKATESRPLRIGIPRKGFPASDPWGGVYSPELGAQADSIFESVVAALQTLIVQDPADIPDPTHVWQDNEDEPEGHKPSVEGQTRRLWRTEFYEDFNAYLASRAGGKVRSLADLVKWNEEHPDLADPPGPLKAKDDHLRASLKVAGARDESFAVAMEHTRQFTEGIDALFRDGGLDILLTPGGLGLGPRAALVASTKQYPLASVPVGLLDSGEPVSVTLMGQHGDDATVLRCMAVLEELVGIYPTPDRL